MTATTCTRSLVLMDGAKRKTPLSVTASSTQERRTGKRHIFETYKSFLVETEVTTGKNEKSCIPFLPKV